MMQGPRQAVLSEAFPALSAFDRTGEIHRIAAMLLQRQAVVE